MIVSEEEKDIDSIIDNTDESESNLNNNTDNIFIEYEKVTLNNCYKKEYFCREFRDISITIVFLEKDIIIISNKIIREKEEVQGKTLKTVETIEENNLFVSDNNTNVDNENRVPSSIQVKGSFITYKNDEEVIPD